jgi:hypothetical protein
MKRRQAIRHIAIATAAAYLLPACHSEPTAAGPQYANIPLQADQRLLLEQFTEVILPKANTEIKPPETATDFVLTVLNDCSPPEDIHKYMAGLTELQSRVEQQYKTDFGALPPAQQAEVFAWLAGTDGLPEPLNFFYEKTRGLAIEHFTTSEYFLKNVAHWEFAPGRFVGCATV